MTPQAASDMSAASGWGGDAAAAAAVRRYQARRRIMRLRRAVGEARPDAETAAHAAYAKHLHRIVARMGSGPIDEVVLDRVARAQGFGPLWNGVRAADEVAGRGGGYMIVNLDPRAKPGSHWIACYTAPQGGDHVYDSFGRAVQIPHLVGGALTHADTSDAEQHARERNCGQRSLAWLCTVHTHGLQCAMLV